LDDVTKGKLSPDWMIAQAWQRMEQMWKGNDMIKFKEYDVLLMKHELEESTLVLTKNMTISAAHEIVEKLYPWDIKIDNFIEELLI
jgi:hypothetical protein